MNDIMVKKAQGKQQVEQPFAMNFFMIECNYNVIDLSIFVIYDVQYVVVAYRSKIN
jgi:hypothetical protein